ncbi:MAG: hypothetical protein HY828_18210 [Actinobacteria bacterium]|nr:hypothetical protein [Actinomycetota bacterium]
MRQFFSPRFWLTLLALGGLLLVLITVFGGKSTPGIAPVQADADPERTIDLISWIYIATPQEGFGFERGATTRDLALQLDATRTMVVKAGTPGEITCPTFDVPGTCTVAADLLGDAVLWFSIVPGPPGATVVLPAVVEMIDGGFVRLANDWIVRRASTVERSCVEDTSSLSDFIRTYGENATSTFNFETQKIVKVSCPREGTDTTDPISSSTVVPSSVIVGTETETVTETVAP